MSNEIYFEYDNKKTVEVLLYISQSMSDLYHILKALYFADRKHIERYGRFISGDRYVAMVKGPVPSGAYDIIKDVKYGRTNLYDTDFMVDGNNIIPLRTSNSDMLSVSDIKCLDEAINEIKHLSFDELEKKSHDDAYKSADENDFISIENIINTFKCKDELLEYLHEC